jgi:hypothetical protein
MRAWNPFLTGTTKHPADRIALEDEDYAAMGVSLICSVAKEKF